MTLQATLVGSDGIVLASDRKGVKLFPVRDSFLTSKIARNDTKGVAVAWSGSEITEIVGREVLEHFCDDWRVSPIEPLENLAKTVFAAEEERYKDETLKGDLVVITLGKLSKFHVIQIDERFVRTEDAATKNKQLFREPNEQLPREPRIVCREYRNKRITGDEGNPAIFFCRYYEPEVSVRELTRLAAQIIVTGAQFNDEGVGGLEILRCTGRGFELVGDEETEALQKDAERLHRRVGKQVRKYPTVVKKGPLS
jgi:hypothetical protein